MKILNNLDLNLNQLLNAIAQQLGSDPGSPVEGQLWYNTASHQLKYYNGSQVVILYRADSSTSPSTLVLRDGSSNINANGATFAQVTISGTPSASTDGVTKGYVDAVAQGLSTKPSATAATTTALPSNTYSAGTLSATGNGLLTVDGISLAANDYLLVKNESSTTNNGLYRVVNPGSGGAPYSLTRALEMDAATEVVGAFVFVEQGTLNANTGWACTTTGPVTLGSTPITFTQFSGAGSVTAVAPLSVTGTQVSLSYTARLANSGGSLDLASGVVSPGTFTSVTVDTYGRVTSGSDISSSNGLLTRTASGTFTSRTVTGTASRISVTNGDGVSGNPTLDIHTSYVGQTSITTLGTITVGTWQATTLALAYGGTGATTAPTARSNLGAAGVYKGTVTGDGSTTTFTLTHNLNSQNVALQAREASGNAMVLVDSVANGVNTVQVTFSVAPGVGVVYNVIVLG